MGLKRREKRVLWAHKVSERQVKKLRWKVKLIRREVKRIFLELEGLHGTQTKTKHLSEEVRIQDGRLHQKLQKILAEVGKIKHQLSVQRERIRRAERVAHFRITYVEAQLRRGRQGQGHAHELLQLAEAQLQRAQASIHQLVLTYHKPRGGRQPPLELLHVLEEEERANFHKIKQFRKKRLNIEAELRLIQKRLLEKSGKEVRLKTNVRRELRRSLLRERRLLQKFKNTEAKVKQILRRSEMTRKKESVLRREVKEEVTRVARQLENLNLAISAYSRKSRHWASMERADRAAPHSKKISRLHHSVLEFQAALKTARDEMVKVGNKLKNIVAKSTRLEDARARITHVYKLKMAQYFLQVHKLENRKEKLKKIISVFSYMKRRGRLGQNSVATNHDRTEMLRKIYNLRSRESKMLGRVEKDTRKYADEMIILNKKMKVFANMKRTMIRKLKWKMKTSKMELVQKSNILNAKMKLENRLIDHELQASKFQKTDLAREADMEHSKGKKENAQLRRMRERLEREVRFHQSGVPRKTYQEDNNH